MTENTWPDPARPGVPLNPDFPGAHWLKGYTEDAWMYDGDGWWGPGHSHKLDPETVAARYSYIGPCLKPDEVAAKEAQVMDFWATIEALRQEIAVKSARIAKLERLVKVLINDDSALGGKDE